MSRRRVPGILIIIVLSVVRRPKRGSPSIGSVAGDWCRKRYFGDRGTPSPSSLPNSLEIEPSAVPGFGRPIHIVEGVYVDHGILGLADHASCDRHHAASQADVK